MAVGTAVTAYAVRPTMPQTAGVRAEHGRARRTAVLLVSASSLIVSVFLGGGGATLPSLVEGAVHESPQQAQRAFVRAETALLRHDRPLAFPGEGVAADAQAGQSRAEQTAASLKRLSVRHQALAHKPPASTSALPENGIAGYSSGGSHMGHAPGFLGQYYFVGSSTGPAGFADYDNRKPTATSYPIEINFQNKGDFKEVDPSLENGQIAARWVGKIEVKAGGKYKFMSKSNNCSWVFVDGQKVIENDGGEDTKESDEINLSQGYHAFTADFFANTDDENMIVKYNGPDTDGSWKLLEGVHRTDFDYLDALSLNNLPDPRPDQLPVGSSRNTWSNIVNNKRNMIFCFTYFKYLKNRENCVHDFTGGPLLS